MKTLRKGDSGKEVSECQTLLNQSRSLRKSGYSCSVDGDFGPKTDACVRKYQELSGLVVDGIVGRGTWAKLLSGKASTTIVSSSGLPPVMKQAESLGHTTWTTPYRMWFFGIRSPDRAANKFDDTLGCAWFDQDGVCTVEYWPGTTDPGTYWLENPSRSSGTAILVEGQYLDVYKIDKHAGKYDALCQRNGEVRVYRDGDRDNNLELDPSTIEKGWFGINLHAATQRAGGESTAVEKWSAGCQVHSTQVGFARMMELARRQIDRIGMDTFSYTLLEEW